MENTTIKIKTTIHVRRFPRGNQGLNIVAGTVQRELRTRKLYVPVSGMCASSRMKWDTLTLVKLAGVDYVAQQAPYESDSVKVGEWVVTLQETDPLPKDLNKNVEAVRRGWVQ